MLNGVNNDEDAVVTGECGAEGCKLGLPEGFVEDLRLGVA